MKQNPPKKFGGFFYGIINQGTSKGVKLFLEMTGYDRAMTNKITKKASKINSLKEL